MRAHRRLADRRRTWPTWPPSTSSTAGDGEPRRRPRPAGSRRRSRRAADARRNCASCHGANFSKPIDPSYPKLAGQHADYLYVALKAYQTEGNPQVGRNNAIMAGMAKPFTLAELKEMAQVPRLAAGELKTVPQSRFR